jgi:RNA polymerase sigma-70 factor (ECF subfamily)
LVQKGIQLTPSNLAGYLFTAVRNKIFDLFAHEQVKTRHLDSLKEYLGRNAGPPTDHRVRENENEGVYSERDPGHFRQKCGACLK